MNALLLRQMQTGVRRASSLLSVSEYRQIEANKAQQGGAVHSDGTLLEFETLELRLHP